MITLRILNETTNEFDLIDVNENDITFCNKYAEPLNELNNYILYNDMIWDASERPNGYNLRDSFKPSKRRNKPVKQSYVELVNIDTVTDKAYGIIVGSNQHVSTTLKVFYEWIAMSQCKNIDNKIFVPTWIANNINGTNAFDWNNKITL